jgi:hypothetical protein
MHGAKETPDEQSGVGYQYTLTMSPAESADALQQVAITRKEYINLKSQRWIGRAPRAARPPRQVLR